MEKQVWFAVHEIDEQLSILVKKRTPIDQLKVLLELRNKIILKHKPSPEIDWTIRNKKVLAYIQKENWHEHWVSVDVPT